MATMVQPDENRPTSEAASSVTAEKPPLLIIGNFLSGSTGVRFVCEDLAEGLRCRGWQVMTASSRTSKAFRLGEMLGAVWLQRRKYSVAQIDVYAGQAFFYAEAAAFSLRILRRPYVLTLHGGSLPELGERWPGRLRRILASAAAVTAPSAYHKEGLSNYRSDIQIVRNGLNLHIFHPRVIAVARPKMIWVRAFHETYNPTLAIRVLSRLSAEFPDVELLMIGPDKGDGSLERTRAEAKRLEVEDRVRMIGAVPKADIPRFMSEGDIFINTTNVDNAPVTVVEAMASGLCVVSTSVGGVPKMVTDGQEALLVPPDDDQAMAEAVARICLEPGLASFLSSNAQRSAQDYAWATVLPQWEQLLRAVAGSWRS